MVALVEHRIEMVQRGEITVPDDADLATFLVGHGKSKAPVAAKPSLTLATAIEKSLESIPTGSLEENSLSTRSRFTLSTFGGTFATPSASRSSALPIFSDTSILALARLAVAVGRSIRSRPARN